MEKIRVNVRTSMNIQLRGKERKSIADVFEREKRIDPYILQIEETEGTPILYFSSRKKISFAYNLCQPPTPEWELEKPSLGNEDPTKSE